MDKKNISTVNKHFQKKNEKYRTQNPNNKKPKKEIIGKNDKNLHKKEELKDKQKITAKVKEKNEKMENNKNKSNFEINRIKNMEKKEEVKENNKEKGIKQEKAFVEINAGNSKVNTINKEENYTKEKDLNTNYEVDLKKLGIKPKGLNNIGATCYMNSVLQCLYHIYDLSNELLKLKDIDIKKMPMTSAYLDVIKCLSFSKNESISPYKFKEIISNNELFEGIEANDSKTLTLYILDTINEEFNDNNIEIPNKKISNKIRTLQEKGTERIVKFFNMQCNSVIGDLFNGIKKSTYKCLKCNEISIDYQIFNIINLQIEQTYNLLYQNKQKKQRQLDILDCFKNEELPKYFKGNNKVFCEKCQKEEEGESNNRIYIAPKIMILFLDRGKYNRFKCDVNFPENLNINEFEEKTNGKGYSLIGVIEHLGPSNMGGHFIANCMHFDGKWYLFSDSTIKGPLEKYKSYGEPYLLFYIKND